MTSWNDYNDVSQNASLIPKGTIAKVRLTIRPGGFDDPSQGWVGGYATRGSSGAVYLNGEFTVLEGPYQPIDQFGIQPSGSAWMLTTRTAI